MPAGSICNVSTIATKGFGFIKPDVGADNVYFHINGTGNADCKDMQVGQRVTYSIETGRNGKPQAIKIVPEGAGGMDSTGGGGGGGGNPFAPLSAAAQSFKGPAGPNPFANNSLSGAAAPSPFGSGSPFGAAGGGGAGILDPFSMTNNPFAAPKAAEWGTGSAFDSLPATQSAFAGISSAPAPFGGGLNSSVGENPFGAAAAATTTAAPPAAAGGGSAFGAVPNPFTSTASPATRSAVAKAAAASSGSPGNDAAPAGDGMTCPLTGTNLGQHNMTVAKLIKRLLATQTATDISMKNVLKNQYGVTAKNSSLPLLADEYARTLLGSARSKAQQGGGAEQQQESTPPSGKGVGGISSRLGASPGGAAGAGTGGGGVSSRLGGAFGVGQGGSPSGGASGGGGDGEPTFVRFKGVRTEEQVRSHFKRVDVLLPDPKKCGPFEYVTQDGNDAHVLKFPSMTAASNAAQHGKKTPGEKGKGNFGVWVITKPSDVAKFASRITADAKRALLGGGGGGGGGPSGGGGGEGEAAECQQCGAVSGGRIDESDGMFYCDGCWLEMEGGGGEEEGGEGGGWEGEGYDDVGAAGDYWGQDAGVDGEGEEGDGDEEQQEQEEVEETPSLIRARNSGLAPTLEIGAPPAALMSSGKRNLAGRLGKPPSAAPPSTSDAAGSLQPSAPSARAAAPGSSSTSAFPPPHNPGVTSAMPSFGAAPAPAPASASAAPPSLSASAPAFGASSGASLSSSGNGFAGASSGAAAAAAAAAAAGKAAASSEGAWGYDTEVISTDGQAPSCKTMLSRKEFDRRVQQGRADESGESHGSNHSISPMERDEHGKAKFELAVCRYEFHRGGAGNVFEHWEIRDLDTMHKTIDHVQSRWMTKRMILHCEPAGYVQVYKMVHDVIKAISSDMAYIRRHYPSSLVIAGVFERCLRIAIDAHYRQAEDLAVENARNLPWASKWLEEHGIPNVAMGMQMRDSIGCTRYASAEGTSIGAHEDYIYKNLMTLIKDVYPELRSKGIVPLMEPEFACYSLMVLSLRKTYHSAIQDLYYNLPPSTRHSEQVRLAMELNQAMEMGNYVRFFDILKRPDTPYLVCCLAHQHMHTIRETALYTKVETADRKIEVPTPLSTLVQHMGFHDEAHCLEYLEMRGIPVQGQNVLLYKVTRGTIKDMPEFQLTEHRKVAFISAKMPEEPASVVGPRPAPPPGAVPNRPANSAAARAEAAAAAAAEEQQRGAEERVERERLAAREKEEAEGRAREAAKEREARERREREEREAKEKAEQARKDAVKKEAAEMLDKALESVEKGDLAGARHMAERARSTLASVGGDVSKADNALSKVKEAEVVKERQEEERREKERKEQEERERTQQDGQVALQGVRNALAASEVSKAKLRLNEAKALFDQAPPRPAALNELEARVKAMEEEEEREAQRRRVVEARREAERQECSKLGMEALSKAREASAAATGMVEDYMHLVRDPEALKAMPLVGIKEAVVSATGLLSQADAHMAKATEKLEKAGAAGGKERADAAAVHMAAHEMIGEAASVLECEEGRRQSEAEAEWREKMERQKKRKQRPLAPANEQAMTGWGVGSVAPPAKRRDMAATAASAASAGATPSTPPLPTSSSLEIRSKAHAVMGRRIELAEEARAALDFSAASLFRMLASHVQIDAVTAAPGGDAALPRGRFSCSQLSFADAVAEVCGIERKNVVNIVSGMSEGNGVECVHCLCGTIEEAMSLVRLIRESRAGLQARLQTRLSAVHGHVPLASRWTLAVGGSDTALANWLYSKVGISGTGKKHVREMVSPGSAGELKEGREEAGEASALEVQVEVTILQSSIAGSGMGKLEGADACILAISLEKGWGEAVGVVEKAKEKLGESGVLVVLLAVAPSLLPSLGRDVNAEASSRLGTHAYVMSGDEVLQAASLAGLNELCGYSIGPRRGRNTGGSALQQALQHAARRSRRVPTISSVHLKDVVGARAAHLFRIVGDASAISTKGMIQGVVRIYNERCVGDVVALSRSLQASAASSLSTAVCQEMQQVVDIEQVSWEGGDVDETCPVGVLTAALVACKSIIRGGGGDGGLMAIANVYSMHARETRRRGGLDAARRCSLAMVREAIFYRASRLTGEFSYVGDEAVWKSLCPLPDMEWKWERAPAHMSDAEALAEPPAPSSPDPWEADVASPPATPPPDDDEEEEEEVDDLDVACASLLKQARGERQALNSIQDWEPSPSSTARALKRKASFGELDTSAQSLRRLSSPHQARGSLKRMPSLLGARGRDAADEEAVAGGLGRLDKIADFLSSTLKSFF